MQAKQAETDLIEYTSVAICTYALLNGDLRREDKAIFVGTNDLPWTSTQQIALLGLLVAAEEGVVLHAERWRHQHGNVFAMHL